PKSFGRRLSATLPLLGKLPPLVRQLFVAPLAFLVPAVRELSVLDRVRAGLLRPLLTRDRATAGCVAIHRHGDLHLPVIAWTVVRSLRPRSYCQHKTALSPSCSGLTNSTAGVTAEKSWRRRLTERKSAHRFRVSQRIRPTSQSRCHPVRSLAEPSPRDL